MKIIVEVLDILGTATKEMKQSRASELILYLMSPEAHMNFREISQEGCRNHEAGGWSDKARQNDE